MGSLRARLLGLLLWLGSAEAAGNAEVFDLGSKLKAFEYTVMLTIVIVGLVLFDLIVEMYEHYLHHHKGRFHQNLFKKAIKELMILGLISFVLFILKDQQVYDQSDEVLANTFDFVNLFLFFVGVSFVLAAVLMVLATHPLKTRWDMYANVPLQRLLALHKDLIDGGWKWYAPWSPRYFTGLRQAQVLEYHLFRSVFLRLNRSLLTPAFDFSKYSGAIVDELIVVFFDVGWASWLLAVVVLFFTLPITTTTDGSSAVSVHGAILFGVALVVLELLVCGYCHYAHQKVIARMGVVGGFNGVGTVLEELWVEPKHHLGQETAAIDVKDLLRAAPVKAPTLEQLTSEVSASGLGASQAQVNFKSGRSGSTSSVSTTRRADASVCSSNTDPAGNGNGGDGDGGISEIEPSAAPPSAETEAVTAAAGMTPAVNPSSACCPDKGADCPGCPECDPLYLPPGRVQNCSMGGDPFVLVTLRAPQSVVDRLPELLKGFGVKVGSYWWFQVLFGMGTLLKCYYSAFYFSYAIGRATQAEAHNIVLWSIVTPLPLLLCLVPLAKRTLPLLAQMACLQGQIVWELVSDIEEQQELAARARETVLAKLQETLGAKMKKHKENAGCGGAAAAGGTPLSRAMDELFEEWDTDGDKKITKDELARGLINLGVYLSAVQIKELFRLADPDHSRSIDPQEFRDFLDDLQTLEGEPALLSRQLTLRLQRCTVMEELRSRHLSADDLGLLTDLGAEAGAETGGGGAAVAAEPPGDATRRAGRNSVV